MEKGKVTIPGGLVYEGELVNGMPHGKGTMTLSDGSVYEGNFVNGGFHGKFKLTCPNGMNEGEIVDGISYSKGNRKLPDGTVYEGDFVGNKFQGKGKMTYKDGDVYEGDFVDDKLQGNGKMTYANGDVYEGEFIGGKLQGKGKKTYKDGKVEEGDWKDDNFLGDVKRNRTKKLVWHLGLSAAYLILLWGTEIIRTMWVYDSVNLFTRCLPLIIYSLAIGIVTSIYSKKVEDNSGFWLPVLMVLLQSITICVWREDVGILFIYLIGRIVVNTLSIVPGFIIWIIYSETKEGESKLTKAQEEAVQELKESHNYGCTLQIMEILKQMNKGCVFAEPYIGFNYTHKHQAYAEFSTNINIPSEKESSDLRIHTTEYGYEHADHTENCVKSSAINYRGCVLDMGTITVDSYKDSQELIDKVFKVLFASTSGCNLYVKGKLIKQSGTLPVYPRQIAVSDD